MALVTLVARAVDGLVLCETRDATGRVPAEAKRDAARLLTSLYSAPSRCSVEAPGPYVFHFAIADGVCYLGLFDGVYPKNFAFTFLEEVQSLFREELKVQFGTGAVDYRSHLDTLDQSYRFQRIDRQITRIVDDFRDTSSSKAIQRLHAGLTEVSNIMRCNLDELMLRGDSLDDVGRKASNLKKDSKEFKQTSGSLWFQAILQKYGILILAGALALVLLICFVTTEGSSSKSSPTSAVADQTKPSFLAEEAASSSHPDPLLSSLMDGVKSVIDAATPDRVLEVAATPEPPVAPQEPVDSVTADVADAPKSASAASNDDGSFDGAEVKRVDAEAGSVAEDVGLLALLGGLAAALFMCVVVLMRSQPSGAPTSRQPYSTVPIAGSFAADRETDLADLRRQL